MKSLPEKKGSEPEEKRGWYIERAGQETEQQHAQHTYRRNAVFLDFRKRDVERYEFNLILRMLLSCCLWYVRNVDLLIVIPDVPMSMTSDVQCWKLLVQSNPIRIFLKAFKSVLLLLLLFHPLEREREREKERKEIFFIESAHTLDKHTTCNTL